MEARKKFGGNALKTMVTSGKQQYIPEHRRKRQDVLFVGIREEENKYL